MACGACASSRAPPSDAAVGAWVRAGTSDNMCPKSEGGAGRSGAKVGPSSELEDHRQDAKLCVTEVRRSVAGPHTSAPCADGTEYLPNPTGRRKSDLRAIMPPDLESLLFDSSARPDMTLCALTRRRNHVDRIGCTPSGPPSNLAQTPLAREPPSLSQAEQDKGCIREANRNAVSTTVCTCGHRATE